MKSEILWEPPADARDRTAVGRYLGWLEAERNLTFGDYDSLWRWSVENLDDFWSSLWDFFAIRSSSDPETVRRGAMPGTVWFPGATLNYAERALATGGADIAVLARSQTRDPIDLTWDQLRDQVARCRVGLAQLGAPRPSTGPGRWAKSALSCRPCGPWWMWPMPGDHFPPVSPGPG